MACKHTLKLEVLLAASQFPDTSAERPDFGPTSNCSVGFACGAQQGSFVTAPALLLGKATGTVQLER